MYGRTMVVVAVVDISYTIPHETRSTVACSPVEVMLLRVSHGLEASLGCLNVHLVVGHACGSGGWVSSGLCMQRSKETGPALQKWQNGSVYRSLDGR